MSAITTHVLDIARGRPAREVPITLEHRSASGAWKEVGRGKTDDDGRLRTLLPASAPLEPGRYRITFDTGAYFGSIGVEGFYPEAAIVFEVKSSAEHFHVPLLLSPYGYSTYRGS